MIRIVKNFDKVGLFVLALVFAVVLGVKAVERLQTESWYEVTVSGSDPNPENNQHIGSTLPGEPASPCNRPSGTICAIQIDKMSYTGTISTVAEADSLENLGLINVQDSRFRL